MIVGCSEPKTFLICKRAVKFMFCLFLFMALWWWALTSQHLAEYYSHNTQGGMRLWSPPPTSTAAHSSLIQCLQRETRCWRHSMATDSAKWQVGGCWLWAKTNLFFCFIQEKCINKSKDTSRPLPHMYTLLWIIIVSNMAFPHNS